MSLGQFILAGNWLIELSIIKKLKAIINSRLFWILILPYLALLIGLLWTENFDYAFHDLRIKLPLFLLPFFFVSTKPITKSEWKRLLAAYLGSLFILTLFSYHKLFSLYGNEIVDKRQLSIKISHIRYGLNIALAIVFCIYYSKLYGKRFTPFMLLLACWLFSSLMVFQLYTGLICLLIVAILISLYGLYTLKRRWLQIAISTILLFSIYLIYNQLSKLKQDFNQQVLLTYNQNDVKREKTINGEYYWHDVNDFQMENGVFVRRFIAWNELERSWNRKSTVDFHGKDIKGQYISYTICRYLSSRGLKKDSIGIEQLDAQEIEAIENGIANVFYTKHSPIENRVYSTFYEFDQYIKTGYANGHSLVMRIEYWKTALAIAKSNLLFGVGTGDVESAMIDQYEKDQSSLELKYRKRTHNQYLSILIAIGLIGLIVFLFSHFFPFLVINKAILLIYFNFVLIIMISSLIEDTLETQAGVTLYTLFNCIFLFGKTTDQEKTSL